VKSKSERVFRLDRILDISHWLWQL
jgi:hypothetical protein